MLRFVALEVVTMKREWLERLRKEKNLTHQDVANLVQISRQYYGMIESGKRDPSVSTAKKIGSLFNIDWTVFFDNKSYKMLRNKNSA
jgi:putative transcriptional regulator